MSVVVNMTPPEPNIFSLAAVVSILSLLLTFITTIIAVYLAATARNIRKSQWLSQQNQAWNSYNALAGSNEDDSVGLNVHNLFKGKSFDYEQCQKYSCQTVIFQRLNILEVDFFGYWNDLSGEESLYSMIADAKGISKNDNNIEFIVKFVVGQEDYDVRFISFFMGLIAYYRQDRIKYPKKYEFSIRDVPTIKSHQIKFMRSIVSANERRIASLVAKSYDQAVGVDQYIPQVAAIVCNGIR